MYLLICESKGIQSVIRHKDGYECSLKDTHFGLSG